MTDQLLPCPFCGKKPRYVTGCYVDTQGNDWPFAECDPCHVGAPVEFWNTRAHPADCEPKPAGVVLPERKTVPIYGYGPYGEGWNACREETARLNGVKP